MLSSPVCPEICRGWIFVVLSPQLLAVYKDCRSMHNTSREVCQLNVGTCAGASIRRSLSTIHRGGRIREAFCTVIR